MAKLTLRKRYLIISAMIAWGINMVPTSPRLTDWFGYRDAQHIQVWPMIVERGDHLVDSAFLSRNEPEQHGAKHAFRLTMPVLSKLLYVGPTGLYLIQIGMGLLLLVQYGRLLEDIYRDKYVAIFGVCAVAFTYAGHMALTHTSGHPDTVAIALVILAMGSRSPWLKYMSLVLACFVDERGALAAVTVIPFELIRSSKMSFARLFPPLAAIVSYLGFRLLARIVWGLNTPVGSDVGVGLGEFFKHGPTLLWELVLGLEALWLFVFIGATVLISRRRFVVLGAYLSPILAIVTAASLVGDIDRSMAYLLPVSLCGMLLHVRSNILPDHRRVFAIVAGVSLLLLSNPLVGSFSRYGNANCMPVELFRLYTALRS